MALPCRVGNPYGTKADAVLLGLPVDVLVQRLVQLLQKPVSACFGNEGKTGTPVPAVLVWWGVGAVLTDVTDLWKAVGVCADDGYVALFGPWVVPRDILLYVHAKQVILFGGDGSRIFAYVRARNNVFLDVEHVVHVPKAGLDRVGSTLGLRDGRTRRRKANDKGSKASVSQREPVCSSSGHALPDGGAQAWRRGCCQGLASRDLECSVAE